MMCRAIDINFRSHPRVYFSPVSIIHRKITLRAIVAETTRSIGHGAFQLSLRARAASDPNFLWNLGFPISDQRWRIVRLRREMQQCHVFDVYSIPSLFRRKSS